MSQCALKWANTNTTQKIWWRLNLGKPFFTLIQEVISTNGYPSSKDFTYPRIVDGITTLGDCCSLSISTSIILSIKLYYDLQCLQTSYFGQWCKENHVRRDIVRLSSWAWIHWIYVRVDSSEIYEGVLLLSTKWHSRNSEVLSGVTPCILLTEVNKYLTHSFDPSFWRLYSIPYLHTIAYTNSVYVCSMYIHNIYISITYVCILNLITQIQEMYTQRAASTTSLLCSSCNRRVTPCLVCAHIFPSYSSPASSW